MPESDTHDNELADPQTQWQKIAALLIYKYCPKKIGSNESAGRITQQDIDKFDLLFDGGMPTIVTHIEGEGANESVVFTLMSSKKALILAKEEAERIKK